MSTAQGAGLGPTRLLEGCWGPLLTGAQGCVPGAELPHPERPLWEAKSRALPWAGSQNRPSVGPGGREEEQEWAPDSAFSTPAHPAGCSQALADMPNS